MSIQEVDLGRVVGNDGSAICAVCNTDAATVEKTVTVAGYVVAQNHIIAVTFVNGNSAENPTLNINDSGAYPITRLGESVGNKIIEVGGTYLLNFNGQNWEVVGGVGSGGNTAVKEYTYTLLSSGWTGSGAPYQYEISISNHTNTSDHVKLAVSGDATIDQITALQQANIAVGYWSDNNTLVLRAYGKKPSIDIPVAFYISEYTGEVDFDQMVESKVSESIAAISNNPESYRLASYATNNRTNIFDADSTAAQTFYMHNVRAYSLHQAPEHILLRNSALCRSDASDTVDFDILLDGEICWIYE